MNQNIPPVLNSIANLPARFKSALPRLNHTRAKHAASLTVFGVILIYIGLSCGNTGSLFTVEEYNDVRADYDYLGVREHYFIGKIDGSYNDAYVIIQPSFYKSTIHAARKKNLLNNGDLVVVVEEFSYDDKLYPRYLILNKWKGNAFVFYRTAFSFPLYLLGFIITCIGLLAYRPVHVQSPLSDEILKIHQAGGL